MGAGRERQQPARRQGKDSNEGTLLCLASCMMPEAVLEKELALAASFSDCTAPALRQRTSATRMRANTRSGTGAPARARRQEAERRRPFH